MGIHLMAHFLICVSLLSPIGRGTLSFRSAEPYQVCISTAVRKMAMIKTCRNCIVVTIIALLFGGCARVEAPAKLVQICVNDADGMSRFRNKLIDVANARKMKFADDSEVVRRDLDTVGYAGPEQDGNRHVVRFRVESADSMGLSVTNVGLYPYQVAMGFSTGHDKTASVRFAEQVIRELQVQWSVEEASQGTGVLPNPNCK